MHETMSPVLSPPFAQSSSPLSSPTSPPYPRRLSSGSVQSLADLLISTSTSNLTDAVAEVVREEGLRHAKIKLDARHYKNAPFTAQLLEILRKLHIRVWATAQLEPADVIIQRVSGALTNAVFFVSAPSLPSARTLLLRVYGPSSGSLISRTRELHILHVLSSRYKIGPRVYGTFENGRIEEYFDSVTLTHTDIRDPQISRWIGARMAELHSVDIEAVDGSYSSSGGRTDDDKPGRGLEIAANIRSWLGPAKEVMKLPGISDAVRNELDLPRFKKEWKRYLAWAVKRQHTFGTRRVFAHNDAQYGNLLRLKDGSEGVDEHRQIIVVDFEYAAPNPAAYDIANHFIEWTANYHTPTPHILDPVRYPTRAERRNFCASYLQHAAVMAEMPGLLGEGVANADADAAATATGVASTSSPSPPPHGGGYPSLLDELDTDVQIWSAASHAGWAIWGIVQAREDVEARVDKPEFDYIGYARGRMDAFRRALAALGSE